MSLVVKGRDALEGSHYPMSTKMDPARANNSLLTNLANINSQSVPLKVAEKSKTPGIHGGSASQRSARPQKLRKLPDGVNAVEVENMPSDISDDEWGEIQKFGQKLHEEQIKK